MSGTRPMTERHYAINPTREAARVHLANGGEVQQFWHSDQQWHTLTGDSHSGPGSKTLRKLNLRVTSNSGLDVVQHGLRLVFPVPERTERVQLHRCIGRALACRPHKVVRAVEVTGAYPTVTVVKPGVDPSYEWMSREKLPLALGEGGLVEVLVDGPTPDPVSEALKDDWNRLLRGNDTRALALDAVRVVEAAEAWTDAHRNPDTGIRERAALARKVRAAVDRLAR